MDDKNKFVHDISNKLFLIQCYVDMLEKDPSKAEKLLPKMKKASNEANQLVHDEKEKLKKVEPEAKIKDPKEKKTAA